MDEDEVLGIIQSAQTRTRHYADYWEWEIDRKRAERGVAQELVQHLGISGRFDATARETPDLLFLADDGRKIGIEVAELVEMRAAAHNRHAEKKRLPHVWAIWSESTVVEAVRNRVAIKNDKLAKNSDVFDEIWLAIATDEPTIDMSMAQQACAKVEATAARLQRAFLLLGYHPDALKRFPSGCAVFPVSMT